MLIGLSKLDEGKGSFAHEYEPDVLDLADERVRLASRTTVSGRARRTSGRVVVEGKIESGVEIDVDEIVREQILLAVPARVLCVEDCKGICATCGTDLNAGDCNCESQDVDPRWAALKSLRTNK